MMRTCLTTVITGLALAGIALPTGDIDQAASRPATEVSAGAATPLAAVAALVGPMATPESLAACQAISGQVAACPITPRLRYRLQHYARNENGNLVSRGQNPPRSVRYAQRDNNGFVARVDTRWAYGASNAYTITFVVARQDDGWRVDDAYCVGRPSTSIYNPPTVPCG